MLTKYKKEKKKGNGGHSKERDLGKQTTSRSALDGIKVFCPALAFQQKHESLVEQNKIIQPLQLLMGNDHNR